VNYVHSTCTKMRSLAVTSGRERAGNYLRSPAQWLMFSLLEAMFTSLWTGGQGQDRTADLPLISLPAVRPSGSVPVPGQAPQARSVVSLPVSFSYVCPGSSGHSRPCYRRSQTVTTHGEHGPTDLESVLATTARPPAKAVTTSFYEPPHDARTAQAGA
jgi:hypothetical protein